MLCPASLIYTRALTLSSFGLLKMLHTMSDEAFELILKVHNVAPFRKFCSARVACNSLAGARMTVITRGLKLVIVIND